MRIDPDARHFRAARAWLGMSLERIGLEAELHPATVKRLETDDPKTHPTSRARLVAYYEARGLCFIARAGGVGGVLAGRAEDDA